MAQLDFRPITETDKNFLLLVYGSTRQDELALTDWNEAQKAAFLEMQFSAQHEYYQEHYTNAQFLVILADEYEIGRLYIARWPSEIRIVDLAILPQFRNLGHGTKILQQVITKAKDANKKVTIHVEKYNPALNLYSRLGFVKIGEHGIYDLMEWADFQAK